MDQEWDRSFLDMDFGECGTSVFKYDLFSYFYSLEQQQAEEEELKVEDCVDTFSKLNL